MPVDLIESLRERERKVTDYFLQPRFREWFKPQDLQDAVFAYLEQAGEEAEAGGAAVVVRGGRRG